LLDQRVSRGVLQRGGGELVGVVVAEIEPLGRGQAGVVFLPGRDLAVGIVGVIELGDQLLVRVVAVVQVFDLLEPFVLRVWEIEIIRR
jgi:hypothetical protein